MSPFSSFLDEIQRLIKNQFGLIVSPELVIHIKET